MRSVLRAGGAAPGVVLRAVLGIMVGALCISGCSSGPSQVGAAALVNGTEIPVEQVQSQLTMVLAKEGDQARAQLAADRQLDDVSRKIITVQIRHELTAIAARRAGLAVDQARVSRLIDEVGGAQGASKGTIFDADGYRERAVDKLLTAQLGLSALRNSAVTVDYTTADTRTAAKAKVDELSRVGAKRARQLIDADVRAGKDAVIGKRIVAADDPIFATTPAFGVDEGTVVAFQLADTTPWLIMVIKNRANRGVQPSDNAPALEQIDPAVLEAIGLRQLAQVGEEVGVRLSPRYGIWDPVSLQAVANENETAGFLAPLRATPRT
ncbi:MAG TPA: SurA N-terminal domain-containing protein [Pseudonocardiaceae bacterium]|nr:SurA N-terminal domain-containing protein [Pseudonocardiaceae bacterium]